MAMSAGLGSMLKEKITQETAKGAAAYVPYVGQAYQVYKAYKGFKRGGILGALSSFIPFGSSIFGGGGSRRKALQAKRDAYGKIITSFEKDFLSPQISNLSQFKRNVTRGVVRHEGDTVRSILTQFEGMGGRLKGLLKSDNFAGIGEAIKDAGKLAKGLADTITKEGGGRGAGPDQPVQSSLGIQNIPVSNVPLEKPVLDLPGAFYGAGFNPLQTKSARPPIVTTQTPGGKRSIRKQLYETPGTLT